MVLGEGIGLFLTGDQSKINKIFLIFFTGSTLEWETNFSNSMIQSSINHPSCVRPDGYQSTVDCWELSIDNRPSRSALSEQFTINIRTSNISNTILNVKKFKFVYHHLRGLSSSPNFISVNLKKFWFLHNMKTFENRLALFL